MSSQNVPTPAGAPGAGAPGAGFTLPQIVLTQQQKTFTLIGAFLGVLLAALDQTIVSTAGPTIQRALSIDNSLYSWITTAYLVASTVMVPIYGKLSDLYGRKPILLIGIGIFLLGSFLCGFATNAAFLIIARAIQGLGSAALFTSALSIISDMFPPAERGKYSGLFGAVFGLSSVVGPLVGGFLTDNISWQSNFYVNLPVGAIALFFIITKMPNLNITQNKPTIDYLGAFWLIVGVVPLLLALSLGKTEVPAGELGYLWGSPEVLGLFALAAIGTVAFILTERRAKDPLLDLSLFRNRTFAVGNAAAFVIGMGFLGAIVFLPLFMQRVVGVSATSSGFASIPLVLGLVVGNIVSGQLVSRFGRYKPLMLIGLMIMVLGFGIAGFTLTVNSTYWEVFFKMIVMGLGLGPSIPLFTLAIQNAVSPMKIGVATASATFFRQMGSTIGVAILGSVFANVLSADLKTDMAAIKADLPASMQSQIGAGGSVGGEGPASQGFDAKKVKADLNAKFETQKTLLTKAIRDNDLSALQTLATDPNTPADQKTQFNTAIAAGGFQQSLQTEVGKAVGAGFDKTYAGIDAAISSGNPAALRALLNNPELPAALKANLSAIPPQALANPQARAKILAQIKTGLDAAKIATTNRVVTTTATSILDKASKGIDEAKANILPAIDKIDAALKASFTDAITTVYKLGILIALLGLFVTLAIPELPLRKGGGHAAPAAE
jgi:EmrB/QacA subfamily drug resistance transporter